MGEGDLVVTCWGVAKAGEGEGLRTRAEEFALPYSEAPLTVFACDAKAGIAREALQTEAKASISLYVPFP